MAMDALRNLTGNIPCWQRRLEELNDQIEKRQVELATLSAQDPLAESRSLRNKGSTESLKPKDDGPSLIPDPPAPADHDPAPESPHSSTKSDEPGNGPSTPPSNSNNGQAVSPRTMLHKHARDAMFAAHSLEQIQLRKRQRSASVISMEGQMPLYRTRSMIIVYYDSYVQGFFDELVRFVASSRNLLRKAKTAARMAQIKRLAEAETPDGETSTGEAALPSLRYMSPRRFGSSRYGVGPPGASDVPQDAYEKLDNELDFVQNTCEHGAHQFLRDANCSEEISKIQKRIAEVLEMAAAETERVEREEPELAKETEFGKVRMLRPISMRRDLTPSSKAAFLAKDGNKVIEPAVPATPAKRVEEQIASETKESHIPIATATIEVDEKIEADDGICGDAELPKLEYRSTRRWARPRRLQEKDL